MTQIPRDKNQGGQRYETFCFGRRLSGGPVCHRNWSHARCGNAVHQSAIPATAIHDHHVGGGQHQWDLHCPEFQYNSHRPSGLLPCDSNGNANVESNIKIEVWLPETTWNGRFLGTGGGDFQGVITDTEYRDELSVGLKQGFAAANSDLGTGTSGCNPLFCGSAGNMGNPFRRSINPSTGPFGHPERIKDFGYRAIHLMTLRSKEIVKDFYHLNAQKAYFAGCSTGGQNALMEAQRFPADYNGILAGDAAFNRTHLHMGSLALSQDTHATPGRFIQPGQVHF